MVYVVYLSIVSVTRPSKQMAVLLEFSGAPVLLFVVVICLVFLEFTFGDLNEYEHILKYYNFLIFIWV